MPQSLPVVNHDFSPHPESTRRALTYFHDNGAHFVLLKGKRPLWRGWSIRRPALATVLHHRELGIVPWSAGMTALDIDDGDSRQLFDHWPPAAVVESGRGEHFYYRDNKPRRNAKFDLHGARGDVRGASGYLRLPDAQAPVRILFGWVHNPDPCLFPVDALEAARYRKPADPGEPYTRRVSREPVDLEAVRPGGRNVALFDEVRFWAYAAPKPASAVEWTERVRVYAQRRNVEFRRPLRVGEVERLALSVSTWVWSGGGPTKHGMGWTDWQRRLGGQTRKRIQRWENRQRDAAIVARVVADGVSRRQAAREFGLTHQAVSHIVRRDG